MQDALLWVDGFAVAMILTWVIVHVRTIGLRQAFRDPMGSSIVLVALLLAARLVLHLVTLRNGTSLITREGSEGWSDLAINTAIGAAFAWRIWTWTRRR